MQKVCFFCGNLNLSGGTERVATSIANELATHHNFEVIMLNLWEGDKPFFHLDSSITNHKLFNEKISFSKNYYLVTKKLRAFLKDEKINTLIVVESMLSLFSIPAHLNLKINHITWEHFNYNVDLGKKSRRLARYLSRLLSDYIVTLTKKDKEIWEKHTYGHATIVAISNPLPYTEENIYQIPSLDKKIVLAVGRLTYQKGFDLLIEIWNIIQQNWQYQDWKLRIIGDGEDKELLNSLIQKYNLNDSVEILPFCPNIELFYQNSSLFCLSSRFEGLGMVLLEAQYFGLPAVSFNCPIGPDEIINDKISGYLCKPNDIYDFAKKLEYLMLSNQNQYYTMQINAKKQAEQFQMKYIIQNWVNLIK